MLAIGKDLLAAQVLLLLSPEAVGILLVLAGHLGLTDLHVALVHDIGRLLCIKALEVVRLDAMRGQHGLLSCRVFGHEVVSISIVNISASLKLFIGTLGGISVALFFC